MRVLKTTLNSSPREKGESRSIQYYELDENTQENQQSALISLSSKLKNPLLLLFLAMGVISFLTGEKRATGVIFVVLLLGVVLRFF